MGCVGRATYTTHLISGQTSQEGIECKVEKILEGSLYRLIVSTLFHIFAMSAIKSHVRFVDCSLIYADFQRLFVFKTFEFGTNFGPKLYSLGFEFKTIYGKICKKMNNPTKNQLSYFG